jgi:hypothetical protein
MALQFLASVLGGHHDVHHDVHTDVAHGHDALDLLSIRALSAGVALFGFGGIIALQARLGSPIAILVAAALGVAGAYGIAFLMRSLKRLEVDRSFVLGRAVGAMGKVYLGIPGHRSGAGKVHVVVQERLMELTALTPEAPIEAGQSVLVIDAVEPDTVVVVRQTPLLEE